MTADPPSFVADVAAQVVAWHNRHPLARRIARKDVHSIGLVVLPYARQGQPTWDAAAPKRGLFALMFPQRIDRRPWAVFSEDVVAGIRPKQLAAFGLRHGFLERPGPPGLPERALQTDRDLLDAPRGDLPPERLNRYLVTAAIDLGPTRPRLMLGHGRRRMPMLGQRLWSLPRLAALGGGLLAAMVIGVAGLWLAAMPQRPGAAKPESAASAASAAAAASGATAPVAAASAAAAVASAPIAPIAPITPIAPNTPIAPTASVPANAPPPPAASQPVPAASPARPPALAEVQRASVPLVPRLRPDLAASARAEAQQHGLPPSVPRSSAPEPFPAPPRTAATPVPAPASPPASAAATPHFFALVTRPQRQRADAEALLKRLRAETNRIAHPTATETGLQQTPEGWRVTWWPFTHPRQAENARAALAARHIELELVEF